MSTYTKTSLIIDSVFYTIFIVIFLYYIKVILFDTILPEQSKDIIPTTIFTYIISMIFVLSNSLQGIIFQKNKLVVKQNIYGLFSILILIILIYVMPPLKSDYFLSLLPKFSTYDLFRKKIIFELSLTLVFNISNLMNSRRIFELSRSYKYI